MSLRKFFLAPPFVNKSSIFKHFLCTHHIQYAKTIAYENTNEDKVAMQIRTSSLSNILVNLESNKELINGSHLVLAITKFRKLGKLSAKLSNQEYARKATEMCSMIDSNVNKLNVSESIFLLDFFSKMNTKESNKVIQSLSNHINNYIHKLSLQDFKNIAPLLKGIPESLTNELRKNLKQRFIIQVATDFNSDNIEDLNSALYFTAYNLNDIKLLDLFINGLNDYKKEIPAKFATTIFHSLILMKHNPTGWLNVLEKIQNVLIENVDKLSINQITFLLYLIADKCRFDRQSKFYNARLCETFVKKLVADDCGLESALSVIKSLGYIRFVSVELLNYTCAAYFERRNLSSEIIDEEFFKLMNLIYGLAAIKHKTVFFDDIKDSVLNDRTLLNCSFDNLCIFALNLINLDCYPIELLSQIFDDKYNYVEKGKFFHWTLIKIYQKLKVNPTYNGPMPTKSQLTALKNLHCQAHLYRKTNNRILYYLEKGMGGSVYVKSNLSSKLFHFIDHAVAFSKDGSPIAINTNINVGDNIEYVEDLNVPPGSQIALILITRSDWYSRNTQQMYSMHSCTIETLEALPFNVITINDQTWSETPSEERTDMLMNKIRSKLALN